MPTSSHPTVHQVKVTLRYTRPPIWRRLVVPSRITLDGLHDVIQAAMGWENEHLYAFRAGRVEYVTPDVEPGTRNSSYSVLLADIAPSAPARFTYIYDFGDHWEHEVRVEKVFPAVAGEMYPACLAGRRAGPQEDVGGVAGHYRCMEALEDPSHPDHERYVEWSGGDYEPDEFSREHTSVILPGRMVLVGVPEPPVDNGAP